MQNPAGDTIAAIATALGPGAIAIVRLSGDAAVAVADTVFRGVRLADCPSHTVHHGRILDADGATVDEVLATVMRAPRSYTTEDMVEFGCHGGSVAARRVLEALLRAGARQARPGEFTERAFLGGRLDLVQAEAVADIVGARTRKGLEIALGRLEGALSSRLSAVRDLLVDFRARVESLIDLPEEDAEPGDAVQMDAPGRAALARIEDLLRSCDADAAFREGVSVAIVGRPNVGKSSVMNALLMRERSIVTHVPGTTRDAIEESIDLRGVPVRLIDTAGWRSALDPAEEAGVRRARAAAEGADLVLLVVDASEPLLAADHEIAASLGRRRTLVVGNKVDLGRATSESELAGLCSSGAGRHNPGTCEGARHAFVSALRGAGFDGLRHLIAEAAGCADALPDVSVNARHADALRRAREALVRALRLLDEGGGPEIVAVEIAEAAGALGEVTGETTPDEVLRHIFDRFCVGK
jgi:tRNA modification GTPase